MAGFAAFVAHAAAPPPRVSLADGWVEGRRAQADAVALEVFQGIPYAAPPLGDLRWKPPQPASAWNGVREAKRFGPRCMQLPLFGDMRFRSAGMSEDCLYLNVWKPAGATTKLPVLVYFFGGGFVAGDGSEPRYDGASLASRGIVTVTVNYRLGVFGFFATPALAAESPQHAAGNYGLLDQVSALRWVRDNIAAFGGDPAQVTIAGESAGSIAVSALMTSPLSRGLFARAIGESGALIAPIAPVPLATMERRGEAFARQLGAGSLAALRALLKERIDAGRCRNWLLYGERQQAHDFPYRDEINRWLAQGQLERADFAWSRQQAERIYVQQRLHEQAGTLREWVAAGAAIQVCGSLQGMAPAVDAVLCELLGDTAVEQLRETGRYRRDVY